MSDAQYPQLYQAFVSTRSGSLAYDGLSNKGHSMTVSNDLPVPINLVELDTDGTLGSPTLVGAGQELELKPVWNQRFVALSAVTGSYVHAIANAKDKSSYLVSQDHFLPPFALGMPPQINSESPVAYDTVAALVGSSKALDGKSKDGKSVKYAILREQSWDVIAGSYALAPGESRQVSFTQEVGEETSDSVQKTISDSIGVGVSGGWGPVNMSVSASLSETSTSTHDVRFTQKTTTAQFQNLVNTSKTASMIVVMWQLTDLVTWVDVTDSDNPVVLTSLTTVNQPVLPVAYWFNGSGIKSVTGG